MRKLTLSLLMVVLASVLGLGWTLDGLFEQYSTQPDEDALQPYRETGQAIASVLDASTQSNISLEKLSSESKLRLSLTPAAEFFLPDALRKEFQAGAPLALESGEGITLNFLLPHRQQVLTLSSAGMNPAKEESSLSLIFTLLFYLGILSLVLAWLYPLIKRLNQLRRTAKALGKGDLTQRVKTESVSYISDIEHEFNNMAQRIETLVSDNKLLSSAISHDLRTPLARLRFGIDILAEEADPALREKYQQRISRDLSEMETLVETFLSYARMDQAMVKVEKQTVDLNDVVERSVQHADTKGLCVLIDNHAPNPSISGDKRYLSMLVNNLLENALRHANANVQLSIKAKGEHIHLTVEDDGQGIPENKRDEVIKPFIRGIDSKQGYGMGLAIVQRIAEWHGGVVDIETSKKLGGASIRVSFSTE